MSATTATVQPDIIRPYGDTTGDGMVQMSFTLPIPHDKRAEGAALQLAAKMGLEPALLVVGGPRFDELATADLGVDRIFGRGTTPREVASYLVHALTVRSDATVRNDESGRSDETVRTDKTVRKAAGGIA